MRNDGASLVFVFAIVLCLSACASKAPRPTSELALAVAALERAEQAGAREYASVEFINARVKKAAADKAVDESKFAKARYLSIEVRVDADLARAKAISEKSKASLKRAQNNVKPVRNDTLPTHYQR